MPRLSVRAGPNLESLQDVSVNADMHPVYLKSDYFEGHLAVRVKESVLGASYLYDDAHLAVESYVDPSVSWLYHLQDNTETDKARH
jgi:hypothetical protein